MLIAKADITFVSLANNITWYIIFTSLDNIGNIEFARSSKPDAVTDMTLWLYTDQIHKNI